MTIFRQGDVLLRKIPKLPSNLKEKDKVLALGEVTGHRHRFAEKQELVEKQRPEENTIVFTDEDGKQFVQVVSPEAVLEHEEHDNITVPQGDYEVIIQREHDAIAEYKKEEAERRVLD
jgi:hypothetical protein